MSAETSGWLNRMTLIGNTLKRGKAWHWRAEDQGDEPNHYDGFIPVEDVKRRLFNFEAVSKPVFAQNADGSFKIITGKQAITHSVTGDVFGVVSDRYKIHQFNEALLDNLSTIIDSRDLGIDSAGLLQAGNRAWVQISIPENLTSKDGFAFRPTLIGTSSHDGYTSLTFKRVMQAVVCDNTLQMAMGEKSDTVKIRHKGEKLTNLEDIRRTLEIVYSTGDDMMQELDRLMAWAVTDNQFNTLVENVFPISLQEVTFKDDNGNTITRTIDAHDTRSAGKQNPKRELLNGLWREDPRVAPWKNSGLGVLQAFTTYNQHFSGSDKNRYNRNYTKLLTNQQSDFDKMVMQKLELITA
jgi:phage/plasmid-like protein (TIGR03299 family)